MDLAQIDEVRLYGFQAFPENTRIPLRAMTLLSGPRVDGANALMEAVAIACDVLGRSSDASNRLDFCSPDTRWTRLCHLWRKVRGAHSCDFTAPLAIGLAFIAAAPGPREKLRPGQAQCLFGTEPLHVQVLLQFTPETSSVGRRRPNVRIEYRVQVNGQALIRFVEGQEVRVRMSHASLNHGVTQKEMSAWEEEGVVDYDGEWLSLRGSGIRKNEFGELDLESFLAMVPGCSETVATAAESVQTFLTVFEHQTIGQLEAPSAAIGARTGPAGFATGGRGTGEELAARSWPLELELLSQALLAPYDPPTSTISKMEEARATAFLTKFDASIGPFQPQGVPHRLQWRPERLRRWARNRSNSEGSERLPALLRVAPLTEDERVGGGASNELANLLPLLCGLLSPFGCVRIVRYPEGLVKSEHHAALADVVVESIRQGRAMLFCTRSAEIRQCLIDKFCAPGTRSAGVNALDGLPMEIAILSFDDDGQGRVRVHSDILRVPLH